MIIATAQPVMADTVTPDQLDQLFLKVGLPIAWIISSAIAVGICTSGELRYFRGDLQAKDWKTLAIASAASIAACTLPSLGWGQFGVGNAVLLGINCILIVIGLALP
ncbi:MAG: hypothetical protein HC768_08420 [Acaryochloris sp. CRU_2_0]|nr:hypothetical protein [Acaryochloris sp. CRU_2_0]